MPPPPARQGGDEANFPLAAQIPLRSFQLPPFPPEASHLRSLTLTSDIKLDEYQSLLQLPASDDLEPGSIDQTTTDNLIPDSIPPSITDLTLELFSLGFPAGWLSNLADRLPRLQSLTLFSCLIDGLNEASRTDAEAFFREILNPAQFKDTAGGRGGVGNENINAKSRGPGLHDLHLIDVFARPAFWSAVGKGMQNEKHVRQKLRAGGGVITVADNAVQNGIEPEGQGLKFFEVSYTYRGHADPEFMNRVPGEELPSLFTPSLVAVSFNLASPPAPAVSQDSAEDLEDPANLDENEELIDGRRPEGILPFPAGGRVVGALLNRVRELEKGGLVGMKMMNLSLWTLRLDEVGEVLDACRSLVDLTICVEMDGKARAEWWRLLLKALRDNGKELEGLEIVGVPSDRKVCQCEFPLSLRLGHSLCMIESV